MSGAQTAPAAAGGVAGEAAPGLLDQILTNTKQTEPDRAQDLVKNLVEQALAGTVTFDKNLTRTFDQAIAAIDRKLSTQLNAIMHDPKFLKLEGSWRGLNYLIMNSETGTSLKIRALNVGKRELGRDLSRAVEFDQSQTFKKIYENEFGTPGGEPYGALIGDYEWTSHPDDIETLRLMSNIAAASFAPFISAAGAGMFGFSDWTELSKPRDLAKIFETAEYMKWRSFRDSEDARFVNLVMPRVIARVPYGAATKPIDEFNYEEAPTDETGAARAMGHHDYCWSNAAYVMGGRLTDAFLQIRVLHRDPGCGGRRQGREPAFAPLHLRRRRRGFEVSDRDRDHRPARVRAVQPGLPAAVPLQEHRLCGVLRRPVGAEAQEVRPAGGDLERGDLGAPALHDGDQPVRALPQGDGARQDRLVHGGEQRRGLAQPLDPELRQHQRQCGTGDEGAFPAARGEGGGQGDPGPAGVVQRGRLSAALAADGGADDQHADGGAHSAAVLTGEGTARMDEAVPIAVADPVGGAPAGDAETRGSEARGSEALREAVLGGRFFGRHVEGASALAGFIARPVEAARLFDWFGGEEGRALAARGADAVRARLERDIAAIDGLLAGQVDALLHAPPLQALEGRWRGLAWLTREVEPGRRVKLRVLDLRWAEICRDLERAAEFDQSQLFRRVYEDEFGTPGGEPFGLLVIDHAIRHRPSPGAPTDDVGALASLASVAAAAFTPTVLGLHPSVLDVETFGDLETVQDVTSPLRGPAHGRWRALSGRADSRFVAVALPRVLARLPWDDDPARVDGFRYREYAPDAASRTWTGAAYGFAACAARAFAQHGWPADVRGAETDRLGGGVVAGLPHEPARSGPRFAWPRPPVEVRLNDNQERALVDAGLMPLTAPLFGTELVFGATRSLQVPATFTGPNQAAANANARVSAQLNSMLCASRFAHLLKVMGRDMVGSFRTADEIERKLKAWLRQYVNTSLTSTGESRARFPLVDGDVSVEEKPGRPGVFGAVIRLQPHYQLDNVSSVFNLVTEISAPGAR